MYRVLPEDQSEILGEELQRYCIINMRPAERCLFRDTPVVVQVILTGFGNDEH